MILTQQEARNVRASFSRQEIKAIKQFAELNGVASAYITQFALVKSLPSMSEETQTDDVQWFLGVEALLRATEYCLHDFVFLPGTMRILNFWILQLLAIDRKENPAIAARTLPMALQIAKLQQCDLHTVWFATRWEEVRGNQDLQTMTETPIMVLDHEKDKDQPEADLSPIFKSIQAIYPLREAWMQESIERIAHKVAEAQAQDFELDTTNINWWPGGDGIAPEDLSKCYYFPTIEAIDVLAHMDPTERRRMDDHLRLMQNRIAEIGKSIARKMAAMLSELPNNAHTAPLKAEMQEHAAQFEKEPTPVNPEPKTIEDLPDISKLNVSIGFYWLMRAFHGDDPASTVFWHICLLESYLRHGLVDLAGRAWEDCRPAFDYHIGPILGLWLLDLRRKLIHLQGNSETLAADLAWLHARENKFVMALQTGNFTSES